METCTDGLKKEPSQKNAQRGSQKDQRKDRLAKALRQNIKRRLEADLNKKRQNQFEDIKKHQES